MIFALELPKTKTAAVWFDSSNRFPRSNLVYMFYMLSEEKDLLPLAEDNIIKRAIIQIGKAGSEIRFYLTLKAPPIMCIRQQFQILPLFQK